MNTSKQVNVMIGLMFLVALFFAVNVINEPNRSDTARHHQTETFSKRGAEIYVNNCRNCHGLEGLGPEEGAIAPKVNNPAFLILSEDNKYGLPPTSEGVALGIRSFLTTTLECGRKGTVMPTWGEKYGGPLSDQQISYLVTLMTEGRFDLVVKKGYEHDSHQNPPATREDILSDGTGLALTQKNCGQYDALTAREYRERDPFAEVAVSKDSPGVETTSSSDATPSSSPSSGGADDALVQGIPVGDYFLSLCATCHGPNREGLVGPALLPSNLVEPDQIYIDTLHNGRAGTLMMAYGGGPVLTDDEVKSIVTWLKTVEP